MKTKNPKLLIGLMVFFTVISLLYINIQKGYAFDLIGKNSIESTFRGSGPCYGSGCHGSGSGSGLGVPASGSGYGSGDNNGGSGLPDCICACITPGEADYYSQAYVLTLDGEVAEQWTEEEGDSSACNSGEEDGSCFDQESGSLDGHSCTCYYWVAWCFYDEGGSGSGSS